VNDTRPTFTYRLKKNKLRQVRRREGRYLLRSNRTETDPAAVWTYYLQLPAQPPPRITVGSAPKEVAL